MILRKGITQIELTLIQNMNGMSRLCDKYDNPIIYINQTDLDDILQAQGINRYAGEGEKILALIKNEQYVDYEEVSEL